MAENTSTVRDFPSLLYFVKNLPPPAALQIFKKILIVMSNCERQVYFYQMRHLYHNIMERDLLNKRPHNSHEVRDAFVDSLRILLAGGPVDAASLSDYLLQLVPSSQWECVLSRVSRERWWEIRGSTKLMREMEYSRPLSIVLLKYGYPYRFDRIYFFSLFFTLTLSLPEAYFPDDILFQNSLRLQMAFEILVEVFTERGRMNREILSLLWKTVPHPFISSTEMFRLMSPFFADSPQKLRDLCQKYVERNKVFEVPEVTSPRSLLHLSRVRVRKDLMDAYSLRDETIEGLNIPRSLKGYLKLDSF